MNKEQYKTYLRQRLSEQYLEEASNARRIRRLGNRVEKGGSLQPGQAEAILRQASADPNLGGNNAEERMEQNMMSRSNWVNLPNLGPNTDPITTKNAMANMMRRAGGLVKIYRGMPDAERGPGAEALVARHGGVDEMDKLSRPGGPTDAQRRTVKILKKQNQALRAGRLISSHPHGALTGVLAQHLGLDASDVFKTTSALTADSPQEHVDNAIGDVISQHGDRLFNKLSNEPDDPYYTPPARHRYTANPATDYDESYDIGSEEEHERFVGDLTDHIHRNMSNGDHTEFTGIPPYDGV